MTLRPLRSRSRFERDHVRSCPVASGRARSTVSAEYFQNPRAAETKFVNRSKPSVKTPVRTTSQRRNRADARGNDPDPTEPTTVVNCAAFYRTCKKSPPPPLERRTRKFRKSGSGFTSSTPSGFPLCSRPRGRSRETTRDVLSALGIGSRKVVAHTQRRRGNT